MIVQFGSCCESGRIAWRAVLACVRKRVGEMHILYMLPQVASVVANLPTHSAFVSLRPGLGRSLHVRIQHH
jgi:hypothetical protein